MTTWVWAGVAGARAELLRQIVRRNLKVKYRGSALGFAWTLLNPLLNLAVLALVFGHVVRVPVHRYWAFLLSGYFAWSFLSQTLAGSAWVLHEHAALRRSAAFPGEILVLGGVLARAAEFLAELGLVTAALAVFHHGGVPPGFAVLPFLVAIQLALALGLVFPLATLAVYYTDVQHALPAALLTLFYASPVFYPLSLVPEAFRPLYLLNPIAALLALYHAALYEGALPDPRLLAGTAAGAAAILVAGHAVYRRHRAVLPEIV